MNEQFWGMLTLDSNSLPEGRRIGEDKTKRHGQNSVETNWIRSQQDVHSTKEVFAPNAETMKDVEW